MNPFIRRIGCILVTSVVVLSVSSADGEVLDKRRAAIALRQLKIGDGSSLISDTQDAHAGFLNRATSGRVIGGREANPGAHPWQIALLVSWLDNSLEAQFCGGVYIGGHTVVTAAHCLQNRTHI